MIENLPPILKSISEIANLTSAFKAWSEENTGKSRALIEELKKNSRYLSLCISGDISIDELLNNIKTDKFDELYGSGFNLNKLNNKKIGNYKSLEKTDLRSWPGKSTSDLVINIYDKTNDLKTAYPKIKDKSKFRGRTRAMNIQKRILLLLRHVGYK